MDQAERKRLEEAGWQVGSVADFLGLTKEETVYIELRVRLTEALKARRQAAKLSQKTFAAAMKSSQSRIAKAEANHQTVSVDLLVRSLIGLGAGVEELGEILAGGQSHKKLKRAASRQKLHRKAAKQVGKNTRKSRVKPAKTNASIS